MMKVTVTDYLYLRSGEPNTAVAKLGYLKPLDRIEIQEAVVGQAVEGNDIWLKTSDGDFIWSGATNFKTEQSGSFNDIPKSYDFWNLKYGNIQQLHGNGLKGNGIKIMVIDSGLTATNTEFDEKKILRKDFIDAQGFANDVNGHGTGCAGVVHARGNQFYGVAPESDLVVAKIYPDKFREVNFVQFMQALDFALDEENAVAIISISLNYRTDQPGIITRVQQLLDKGVAVVAAQGNLTQPASALCRIKGVVSVGAFDKDQTTKQYNTPQAAAMIYAPGVNIPTTSSIGIVYPTGTSYATPYIAGIVALAKQKFPNKSIAEIVTAVSSNLGSAEPNLVTTSSLL